MISLDKIDWLILKLLYKSNGRLESYTTYSRSKVGFKSFALSIRRLIKFELILDKENYFVLTEKGKNTVAKDSSKTVFDKNWREVPTKYLSQRITSGEPYIPSKSLLDKRSFT